jgi:acetoacetate decarboxylase
MELVRYHMQVITIKEAWSSTADLQLLNYVIADVAKLPVLEILSTMHFVEDVILGMGKVVYDYMKD